MFDKLKNCKGEIFAYISLLVYSIVTKFFMSINSPFFGEKFTDTDHAIFYTIGKELIKGKILYKEIFDHKTPYIYFLNAFASLLDYKHIGLFILDIIVLFISLCFIYKISKLFLNNEMTSIIAAGIMGFILTIPNITFSYNRTEEYAILFLLHTSYIFIKYFTNTEKTNFKIADMYIIGILAGLTFMTNIRAVVLFLPYAFVLLFILIKDKQYKRLIFIFFAGILGVVISIMPYIIYALNTNSLNDGINAIVDANLSYLSSENGSHGNIIYTAITFISENILFFIVLLISFIIMIIRKYNVYTKNSVILMTIIAFVYVVFSNRTYVYYLVILMPFILPLIIFVIKNIAFDNKYITIAAMILIMLLNILFNYKSNYNRNYNHNRRAEKIINAISEHYSNISDLKILAFGMNPEVYMYLENDVYFKYFMIPLTSYNCFSEPYKAQYNYVTKKIPDVIIYRRSDSDKEFPNLEMTQIRYTFDNEYETIATIKTNGIEGEYYIYAKK